MPSDRSRKHVASGGPAAINGVLYQLLWSLFRALRVTTSSRSFSDDGTIDSLTIKLEPQSGGDLQIGPVIEQVKARPQLNSWSLREVICKVIPDLYRSSWDADPEAEYRFVTEAQPGKWQGVPTFFRKLGRSPLGVEIEEEDLDDSVTIFSPQETGDFWTQPSYTERSLLRRIVEALRKTSVTGEESFDETSRRLQRVLGAFEFVEGRTEERIRLQVDRTLLGFANASDEVPALRKQMLATLAERAVSQQEFYCSELLQEHGLNEASLTRWTFLQERSRRALAVRQHESRYEPSLDVRPGLTSEALEVLESTEVSVLVIRGQSGQGKSWLAHSVLDAVAAREADLVALVRARGDAETCTTAAATTVWQEIAERSTTQTLEQIGGQIRKVLGRPKCRWLTLVFDDVSDAKTATELATKRWDHWGIRVIFTCPSRTADRLRRRRLEWVANVATRDFTDRELFRYLKAAVGDRWSHIGDDVRRPLTRPIIADTFRQIAESKKTEQWLPSTEYEVFDRLWDRIESPSARVAITALAREALPGKRYPWTDRQLAKCGVGESELRALKEAGWLQENVVGSQEQFSVPHDRLLAWAVAQGLVSDLQEGAITVQDLCARLSGYMADEVGAGEFSPEFVPMDTFWIAASVPELKPQAFELLKGLEGAGHLQDEHRFYENLVPTIGAAAIPLLVKRLNADEEPSWFSNSVVGAIVRIGGDNATSAGIALIREERRWLKGSGVRILARWPTGEPGVIDELWDLLAFAKKADDPELYHGDVFRTLRSCVVRNNGWLEQAIEERKDGIERLHELVWLIRGLPIRQGGEIWARHKEGLVADVLPENARCLASCFGRFGDEDDIPWLVERLPETSGWISGVALQGLARVSPEDAIQHLHEVPPAELNLSRNWFAGSLFHFDAPRTRRKLLEMMSSSDEPWRVAGVYEGREQQVDAPTIDFLLARLEADLRQELDDAQPDPVPSLWVSLRLLRRFRTVEALEAFRGSSRSALAGLLAQYILKVGPIEGAWNDGVPRDEALEILARLGESDFAAVTTTLLGRAEGFALRNCVHLSARISDSRVVPALERVLTRDDESDLSLRTLTDAAMVLADSSDWKPAIDFVVRSEFETRSNLMDWPRAGLRPPSTLLDRLREVTRKNPTVGSVLALGLGEPESDREILQNVLRDRPPENELCKAAVIALELIGDESPESVPLISRQYGLDGRKPWATRALLRNGTRDALVALQRGPSRHDLDVRVKLINSSDWPEEIDRTEQWLTERAEDEDDRQLVRELRYLLSRIQRKEDRAVLLRSESLYDSCLRMAYSDSTSIFRSVRGDAIWCLIRIDPTEGCDTALAMLRNPSVEDREQYPDILVDAGSTGALSSLLDHVEYEKSTPVKTAIARAVCPLDIDRDLMFRASSGSPETRAAACFIAGWAGESQRIIELLDRCLRDVDPAVATAAGEAINRIAKRSEAQLLAERVQNAGDRVTRWRYLDCLLEYADPGDEYSGWPVGGPNIWQVLSPLQASHARSRLEKRRKTLVQRQEFEDRSRRDS